MTIEELITTINETWNTLNSGKSFPEHQVAILAYEIHKKLKGETKDAERPFVYPTAPTQPVRQPVQPEPWIYKPDPNAPQIVPYYPGVPQPYPSQYVPYPSPYVTFQPPHWQNPVICQHTSGFSAPVTL
jgi:hypothetical protein